MPARFPSHILSAARSRRFIRTIAPRRRCWRAELTAPQDERAAASFEQRICPAKRIPARAALREACQALNEAQSIPTII